MRSSKVVPADAAPAEPIAESKLPRAPLLRRLVEIEQTIANIKAPDTMDGYKTMPLHTAARRGDMREVAALLPTHHASLTQRDEAGGFSLQGVTLTSQELSTLIARHSSAWIVEMQQNEKRSSGSYYDSTIGGFGSYYEVRAKVNMNFNSTFEHRIHTSKRVLFRVYFCFQLSVLSMHAFS